MVVQTMLLCPITSCAQAENDLLGTLFYSSAERAAIVAGRKDEATAAYSSGAAVSLSGLVRRPGRKSTAWINGQIVEEGQAVTAAGVPSIGKKTVLIDGREVKVRETLDLETGTRTDALPQGAVSVRNSK